MKTYLKVLISLAFICLINEYSNASALFSVTNEEIISTEFSDILSTPSNWKLLTIDGDPPLIIKGRTNDRYGSANIKNLGSTDTLIDFHLSRNNRNSFDTIINPFELDTCTKVLKTDATHAYVSYSTNNVFKTYNCTSYSYFRSVSIDSGNYIKYDTAYLINSDHAVDCYYSLHSIYNYQGSITCTSISVVTFLIPDLISGFEMTALKNNFDVLPHVYNSNPDSNYKYITVTFPVGTTSFILGLAHPCAVDCYFPSASVNIDTTFNSDDQDLHTLGHKLTIKQSKGLLHITKGTRINFCPDAYILNRDSLIIEGPCQTSQKTFDPCSGIKGLYTTDLSSAIVIDSGSALILDSGSYTYLKAGGAIWVKQYGSFIAKNYSFLQVGDSNYCGYGEIIADAGSYLYIEANAHVEFRKTIGDTADRNLINVGSTAGVYTPMGRNLFIDGILPKTLHPISICDLDSLDPVKNREWGYCNFSKPLATYQTRNDTLCPGEPFYVRLERILNEDTALIVVCRMSDIHKDSFAIADSPYTGLFHYRIPDTTAWTFHYKDTCIQDTFFRDSLPPGDHPCKLLHNMPDDITYYFRPNTLHRITIKVWNSCGKLHDTTGYIYIADTPKVSMLVPTTACAGIGTLTVNIVDSSYQPVSYAFSIAEMPDTTRNDTIMGNLPSYSVSDSGYLPSSFTFSTFQLKGNRTYLVSLAVGNSCGSYTSYGFVSTPLFAKINLHLASTYNNPVGPAAFQLEGIIGGTSTFHWSPTTYLSDSTILDPVSMPSDPIRYILTATGGGCTDRDTVNVLHNTLAYAGSSREICNGDSVMIGTNYEGAIALGILDYLGGGSFESLLLSYQLQYITPPGYFQILPFNRYLSYFMISGGTSACAFIGSFMAIDSTMKKIHDRHWFPEYYQYFIDNGASVASLQMFSSYLTADTDLKSEVDGLSISYDGSCVNGFFTVYQMYYNTYQYNNYNTAWDYKDDSSTTWNNIGSWTDFFNMQDAPPATRKYRITVVDNFHSLVEYDSVFIYVDSILSPNFSPVYQIDSTVYFINSTIPLDHSITYSWNFGDGSTGSTNKNPSHTFVRFDSAYRVCLTASNNCGSYQFCDTVHVDSTTLMAGGLFKKGNTPPKGLTDIIEKSTLHSTSENYLSVNVPNPFREETFVEYSLANGNHDAQLRITTSLGEFVKSYKLQSNKGIIIIDGSSFSDGMYYYSLIVDGAVVNSKTMIVQH